MIISFFGHADFQKSEQTEDFLIQFLKYLTKETYVEFYFGEYGAFDSFSYSVCKNYKTHCNCKLIFVTPYLEVLQAVSYKYDEVIYPNIENIPLRYSIIERNKWIVEKSDFIFFYVAHDWGGAYKMLEYAKKKGKQFINLADICR